MLDGDFGLLPVVSASDQRRLVGALTRGAALRADLHRRESERSRERFLGLACPRACCPARCA